MNLEPTTAQSADDVRRVSAALQTAVRLSGVSQRACERDLDLSPGYLTRILNGEIHLRVALVFDLCRLLRVPPGAFFASLFPDSHVQDEATSRLLDGLAALHPPSPVDGRSGQREALRLIRAAVRTLEHLIADSPGDAPPAAESLLLVGAVEP